MASKIEIEELLILKYIAENIGHYNTTVGYLQIPLRDIRKMWVIERGKPNGCRDTKKKDV